MRRPWPAGILGLLGLLGLLAVACARVVTPAVSDGDLADAGETDGSSASDSASAADAVSAASDGAVADAAAGVTPVDSGVPTPPAGHLTIVTREYSVEPGGPVVYQPPKTYDVRIHWDHAGPYGAGFEVASNAGESLAFALPMKSGAGPFTPHAGDSFTIRPFASGAPGSPVAGIDAWTLFGCTNACKGALSITKSSGGVVEGTFIAQALRPGDAPEQPTDLEVTGAFSAICEGSAGSCP